MANTRGDDYRRISFKVVLLGEGAVGKTSLVLRYVENKFNDKHVSTLQVDINGSYSDETEKIGWGCGPGYVLVVGYLGPKQAA